MLVRVLKRRHTAAPVPAPITRAVVLCSVTTCATATEGHAVHDFPLCPGHYAATLERTR